MDFALDHRTRELHEALASFLVEEIRPAEPVFHQQVDDMQDPWAWSRAPNVAWKRSRNASKTFSLVAGARIVAVAGSHTMGTSLLDRYRPSATSSSQRRSAASFASRFALRPSGFAGIPAASPPRSAIAFRSAVCSCAT